MAAAARRGLVFSLLLTAAAGCGADQPVLTLVFASVPIGTKRIDVTLHGANATFMGPDAGNDQVGVSYMSGNVVVGIDAAYAAARANHIRLPLAAGNDIPQLEGTAVAKAGGVELKTVAASTPVMAHTSATMTFDFGGSDASADAGPDTSTDGGALDATADSDAGGGTDAGFDVNADASADTRADTTSPDTTSSDVAPDAPRDVPADMLGTDTPADMSSADAPADRSSVDAPADKASPPDATILPNCTLHGPHAASVGTAGSGATVAYAAPLFGVAWRTASDILYNAVSESGTLQLGADRTVVAGTGQGLNTPRLARVGNDFILAYGRHDGTGAQVAVVGVAPATGVATAPAATGMNRPGLAAAPDVGGVAVSGDEKQVAVISRASDPSAQTASIVDEFNDAFTFVTAKMPSVLGARTTGIGWAPGRFLAGAVTQATSTGGILLELSDDTNLTVSTMHAFTSGSASPVVGSGSATISVAGAVDRVAVAWVDLQGGKRVVTLALVPFSTGMPAAPVPASTSAANKSYPHLVFDGVAFAVAWLEGSGVQDSQIMLQRFDTSLTPVGAPITVGNAGAVGMGDFDIAAAGPNAYGIAAAGATSTQQLFYITCD